MNFRSRSLTARRISRLRLTPFFVTILVTFSVFFLIGRLFFWSPQKSQEFTWTTSANRYAKVNGGNNRKFLAYLPHSGFHNQRIELENAVVLSKLLNRTLVLPLARLGAKPLPYKSFDALLEAYSYSDKSWLSHCIGADTGWNATLKECRKYDRFTHISWQDVISIQTWEDLGVKFVERWDFRPAWVERQLGIKPSDVYSLKDSTAYDFQFCDDSSRYTSRGKYSRRISLFELNQATSGHRLLQLGTLFGSSRLRLSMPENQLIYSGVRASFKLSNRFLEDLATSIVTEMGGIDNFYGIHLRVGDGLFSEQAVQNARIIWWSLLMSGYSLRSGEVSELERSIFENASSLPQAPLTLPLREPSLLLHNGHTRSIPVCCKAKSAQNADQRFRVPLFIATDAIDIKSHPALQYFTGVFSCVMVLSEFKHVTVKLDDLINPLDGSHMTKFLLPFLDAMVISKSSLVYGTPESTFSKYIENVLWPLEHGRDIDS